MESREARECTPVYFGPLRGADQIVFETRQFNLSTNIVAQPFVCKPRQGHRRIHDVLKGLYREHCAQIKRFRLEVEEAEPRPAVLSREQKINFKRRLIAKVMARQPTMHYRQVCSITGCSYSMVRRVRKELQFSGSIPIYSYPNLKKPAELFRFEESVNTLQGSFKTLADLKRENPTFSRRWIARHLRRTGFRWRMLTKRPKVPVIDTKSPKDIIDVVSHLTQALNSPRTAVVYVDEAHFPLFQTSERRWTLGLHQDDRIYNRRVHAEAKLSVVAACDLHGFIAIQVFRRDVTSNDFLHLLQAVLERYHEKEQVTVLADQATWHTSPRVLLTTAGQFIRLNVPGLFRVNAIENSFSFVRSEFRKRALVNSFEEEAALLVSIFFHPDNARRFEGIHKNHLRQLILVLRKYSAAFEDGDDSVLGEL